MADQLRLWSCDLRPHGFSAAESERIRSVGAVVEEAAREVGLPAIVILAVIWVESRCQSQATSSAGAQGLMQLMPSTGAAVARSLGIEWVPTIPRTNVRVGATYLRRLADQISQDMSDSVPAWWTELGALLGREPTVIDAAWGAYFAGLRGLRSITRGSKTGAQVGRYVAAVEAAARKFSSVEAACQGVTAPTRRSGRSSGPITAAPSASGGGAVIALLVAAMMLSRGVL